MEEKVIYMELREMFEQMNPQEVKKTIDRIVINKKKSFLELKVIADDVISELLYRTSCYPSEVSDACSECLSEIADRIMNFASDEAIEKAYNIINQ